MVMENSARVWRCAANSPFVLAIADCVTPVVKIPAAVCLFFSAMSATRATARARSAGVACAVFSKERGTFVYFFGPGLGGKFRVGGWVRGRAFYAAAPRRKGSPSGFFLGAPAPG